MGNVQAILRDCQLGQVPAYLQPYVFKGQDGDEAYMVYGERAPAQQQGFRDDNAAYVSGPSQGHVRSNLLEKGIKSKKKSGRDQRKVLADIVDLCVDGIDSEGVRDQPPLGSRGPGGQTFSLPEGNSKHLNSEVWDEAEYRASAKGAMRVTPGNTTRVQQEQQQQHSDADRTGERSSASKKRSSKSKKKTKRSRRKAGGTADSDGDGETIISTGEGNNDENDGQQLSEERVGKSSALIHEDTGEQQGQSSGMVKENMDDHELEDTEYESEVEQNSLAARTSTAHDTHMNNGTPLKCTDPSLPHNGNQTNGNQTVTNSSNSSSTANNNSNDSATLNICREEELVRLERLCIVVHPSEAPDSAPDSGWFLLEAGWFRKWSAFLRGAARPGRIRNAALLNTDSSRSSSRNGTDSSNNTSDGSASGGEESHAWPGLRPGKDYVGLDNVAWRLLSEVYGADVAVVRVAFDIYSAAPSTA